MTWTLVRGLTGIFTNDDFDSSGRGYEHVVAVKTHYPVKKSRRRFEGLDARFARAIVVLRNPLRAVPSYFNLQYELTHKLPNHSTRGPNEDWLRYRDSPSNGLAVQIANYEKFVDYWMAKYDRRQLLLLSYEDLTDGVVGPLMAGRLARFLGEVEGVDPVAPEMIPCVWKTIVKGERIPSASAVPGAEGPSPEGSALVKPKSLRVGPKERPYTSQNLADIMDLLRRLADRYRDDEEFLKIMLSYIGAVSVTVPVE